MPRISHSHKSRTNTNTRRDASSAAVALKPNDNVHIQTSARTHFSDKKFQDLTISPQLKARIQHEYMTEVQAVTIEPALSGKNLLVQAKTGTGKTLGFLLPPVENLLKNPLRERRAGVPILVISPTRELALQIAEEAKALHPELLIGIAIGGSSKGPGALNRFADSPFDIVIATPGRLFDYFTGEKGEQIQAKFRGLRTLVLDEVDRLLDGGFARELNGVIEHLPAANRQNLFFSATISDKVKHAARKYISSGEYEFLSTLREDEVNAHQHVHQSHIITPFNQHLSTLLALMHLDSIKHALPGATTSTPSLSPGSVSPAPKSSSKVVVFFPTARHVSFASALFSSSTLKNSLPPVYELHSRKSQAARTKATEAFRVSRNAILLSSDVAARGVDFPGVTLVIQVGLPSSSDQYIHRLGRTARAGADGQGIIILDPSEERFLTSKEMRELKIVPYIDTPSSHESKQLSTYIETHATHVAAALNNIMETDPETIESAYRAWLGYYSTNAAKVTRWGTDELVERAFNYAKEAMGWKRELPPSLEARTIGKMRLKGAKGLNIESHAQAMQRKTRREEL